MTTASRPPWRRIAAFAVLTLAAVSGGGLYVVKVFHRADPLATGPATRTLSGHGPATGEPASSAANEGAPPAGLQAPPNNLPHAQHGGPTPASPTRPRSIAPEAPPTGETRELAEPRSVDDQVEWLDDGHVLYALPAATSGTVVTNVWALPADASGAPRLLVPGAASPVVIRDAARLAERVGRGL